MQVEKQKSGRADLEKELAYLHVPVDESGDLCERLSKTTQDEEEPETIPHSPKKKSPPLQ